MGRRSLIALCGLVLAGALALVLADRPWASGMTGEQAARALDQRLGGAEHYRCSADHGLAVPGEPNWTYECLNSTDPQKSGYFVLVRDGRVAEIQPSG